MADRTWKEQPLHDLLENLYLDHKHDIHLYCHGHLNYKNLYTPPERVSHKAWVSSRKDIPIPETRQPSKVLLPKRSSVQGDAMKEAIYDFTMGTAGSLPPQGPGVDTPAAKKERERGHWAQSTHSPPLETRTTSLSSPVISKFRQQPALLPSMAQQLIPMPGPISRERQSQQRYNSVASYVADNVYIEELRLPELMLPTPQRTCNRTNSPLLAPVSNGQEPFWQRHHFVETHLGGITKKDQFHRFKDFQSGILKTSEMFEKEVLSGRKAVEHLEKQLYEDLVKLSDVHRQCGPNFHRLQIYSNAWQALIEDSPIFRDILTDIKTEYEVYMGSLLDTQPQKHSEVLCQQVDNLAAGSPVVPGEVMEGFKHVEKLEVDAKELLAKNDRLRQLVREEWERIKNRPPPTYEAPKLVAVQASNKQAEPCTITDQILEIHASILEKMDELRQLRSELQDSYVPISVCQHLDQCVRDTEAEVLKVLSTNEYLEKTIQQLELNIEKLMERANTSDTTTRFSSYSWIEIFFGTYVKENFILPMDFIFFETASSRKTLCFCQEIWEQFAVDPT